MEFKPGDKLRHKATRKLCVMRAITADGDIEVTTQDDQVRWYKPEELEMADDRNLIAKDIE